LSSCSNTMVNPKKARRNCLECGKECKRLLAKYCSIKCGKCYQHEQFIKRWKRGKEKGMKGKYAISNHIRRYLIETRGEKCENCGWNKRNLTTLKVPLDVEHKDGNYKNNKEKNLRLLCPNCHSLTPTYKGLNMGSGRKSRLNTQINLNKEVKRKNGK